MSILNIILYIIIAITSSLVTMNMPRIINKYKRVINRFKRPNIQQIVKAEVERQLKEILND